MNKKPAPKKIPPPPKKCKRPDCEKDAKFGGRGLCAYHYVEEQKAKAAALKVKEKKAKNRQKKADSFTKLKEVLDSIFSRFIRLRDTDRHGVGFCIDCGERVEWGELDNGHFISRDRLATRWDELNCAAQKTSCNRFHSGRQFEFAKGLDNKYGQGTADLILAKSYQITKYSTIEMKEMIALYSQKVEKLLKEKDFQPWAKK